MEHNAYSHIDAHDHLSNKSLSGSNIPVLHDSHPACVNSPVQAWAGMMAKTWGASQSWFGTHVCCLPASLFCFVFPPFCTSVALRHWSEDYPIWASCHLHHPPMITAGAGARSPLWAFLPTPSLTKSTSVISKHCPSPSQALWGRPAPPLTSHPAPGPWSALMGSQMWDFTSCKAQERWKVFSGLGSSHGKPSDATTEELWCFLWSKPVKPLFPRITASWCLPALGWQVPCAHSAWTAPHFSPSSLLHAGARIVGVGVAHA